MIHIIGPSPLPLLVLAGLIILTTNMHLAKGLGSLHAKLVRTLLVAEKIVTAVTTQQP